MSIPTVSLRDIVEAKTGTRTPTALPEESFTYVDVASVDNESKSITGSRSLFGSEAPSRARKVIRQGDILVSTIRPNLNAVALVPADLDGQIASTGFCVLRPTDRALSEYLFYFVQSQSFVGSLCTLVAGAMYPAVSDSQVLGQRIPLPDVVEQRRIVDLLSRAEGIVRLRRYAQKKAAELIPAIFVNMFGDPATNPKGWLTLPLNEVSEVISGVAKGRQLSGDDLIELPYVRVGNVKDGHLDLSEVKTIEIKRSEVEKLRIEPGDLLMTEGGDPDKLGRAALWCGEIDLCVHQNHIFKVRGNRALLLPEYLRSLVSSAYGKAYFLRVAKKTTGIASINKTQLSAFPVVLPRLDLQEKFKKRVEAVESVLAQQVCASATAQSTFDSLLATHFRFTKDDK